MAQGGRQTKIILTKPILWFESLQNIWRLIEPSSLSSEVQSKICLSVVQSLRIPTTGSTICDRNTVHSSVVFRTGCTSLKVDKVNPICLTFFVIFSLLFFFSYVFHFQFLICKSLRSISNNTKKKFEQFSTMIN